MDINSLSESISINDLKIGDYILVNGRYFGKIVDIIWSHNGYIIKLENYENYVDELILTYKITNFAGKRGYMLVKYDDNILKIDTTNICEIFPILQSIKYENISQKIYTKLLLLKKQIDDFKKEQNDFIRNKSLIVSDEKMKRYKEEEGLDDDYAAYVAKMYDDLFVESTNVKFEDNFINPEKESSLDILGQEQIDNDIKPAYIQKLEEFDSINDIYYYDLKNTLMYKHLIYDDDIDTISLGKELINKIKESLLILQQGKIEGLESVNIFDFLTFKIIGGYIEISSIYPEINDRRIITQEIVPNLKILRKQYGKPIDYRFNRRIILQNKTEEDIMEHKDIANEAIKILSQEYLIAMQPKVEFLFWVLVRLIVAWFAHPKLNENIFKIKVLINLFRGRGAREINKDIGIMPIIIVVPQYGKKSATTVLSFLSYFFFPYRRIGMEDSTPTYFNKLDDLLYYTNGSIELKKYIKYLIKLKRKITNPMNEDMTSFNIPKINIEHKNLL
jgi:hypothetical protein